MHKAYFAAQRCALVAGGWDETRRRNGKKPKAKKMPKNAVRTYLSTARCVGRSNNRLQKYLPLHRTMKQGCINHYGVGLGCLSRIDPSHSPQTTFSTTTKIPKIVIANESMPRMPVNNSI